MLVKINYTGKGNTIYECDRCHKRIDTGKERRIRISAQISQHSKYKNLNGWDFCEKCYISLIRGIKKGVAKK